MEEGEKSHNCTKSWKGYDFDIINELIEKELIDGSYRSKSIHFTEEGIEKSEELKYIGEE